VRIVDTSVQLSGSHELLNETDVGAHHAEHMSRKDKAVKWYQRGTHEHH